MDRLQLVYPYYDNPTMLKEQLTVWDEWPQDLKDRTTIILVDDGSQKDPAEPIIRDGLSRLQLPLIRLYRVLINIPWNQNGAHNLGFHVADDGWCLSTDIDHVVTAAQLNTILALPLNKDCYYTFGRRRVRDMSTVYKRHPNSWLLTKKLYWEAGGYDEDFAGFYGSDSQFRRALTLVGKHIALPDACYLVVYDEQDIPDANTREWGRKDSEYHSARNATLAKKRQRAYKAENPLRFPWERVL